MGFACPSFRGGKRMPTTEITGLSTGQIVSLVATSSVVAAFLTQGLAWFREWWGEAKQAKFAALYISIALEAYARTCASLISDSEAYEASNEAAGAGHGNIAEIPEYPEVDWQAFGIKHAERAMTFRTKIDNDRAMIRDMWEHGDEDDIVPFVREKSGEHGLAALAMAEMFRAQHGLNPLDDFGKYSTQAYLARRHAEQVEERVRYEERRRKQTEELFGQKAAEGEPQT